MRKTHTLTTDYIYEKRHVVRILLSFALSGCCGLDGVRYKSTFAKTDPDFRFSICRCTKSTLRRVYIEPPLLFDD